jgi:hypothetical protein
MQHNIKKPPPLQGVRTYAVGVTEAVNDEQLLAIAGDVNRVYKVRDFTKLDTRLRDAIVKDICTDNSAQSYGGGRLVRESNGMSLCSLGVSWG